MNAKEIREKLGPLAQKIKGLADTIAKEGRTFSAEEQAQWDALNGEYNTLKANYDAVSRAEELDRQDAETRAAAERAGAGNYDGRQAAERHDAHRAEPVTAEHRADALRAWVAAQRGRDITEAQRHACKLVGLNPAAQEFDVRLLSSRDFGQFRDAERRALSAANNATGGYTVPDELVRRLERAMLFFGPMRQVATVIRTSGVGDLSMPTSNDTSNKGAIIAESAAVTEQDISVGAVVLRAHKYTSKLVKVPVELLEDSSVDVAALLGDMLGERIGRILNDHFTTGVGTNEPRGIVTASTAGKTTNSGTAITLGELIDLQHSVDIAYRDGAAWMMHDGIVAYIRKITDTASGQLIWQPSLQAGVPDRLLGFPVFINNSMQATVATTTKTILFGQLAKYIVRDVGALRLRRLVERYADNDQEGFVAFSRHDGNLLDAGVAPVKHMLQA